MDSRIQKILQEFRKSWNNNSLDRILDAVADVDSNNRQLALQSIVAVDIEKRAENELATDSEHYRELGSNVVEIARQILDSDTEIATVLPSSNKAGDSQQLTTAPGYPMEDRKSELESDRFLHFDLLSEIARGGMGVVYKARDTKLNRIVALKMIIAGKLASEEEKFRFNLEAEAAAKLDHPGITPIYEVGEHQGQPYFAMKLVEGGSLADHLENYTSDPKKAAQLVADIAHAIHHAHQRGTLHRDLKPNNILLDDNGQPLVTDFGLAKLSEHDTDVTQSGVMMGTPGYMPPEQVSSSKNVTTSADIYSLGAILFATLTGRPPFVGQTAMETVMQVVNQEAPRATSINSKTPIDLELVIQKCLDRNPDKRYESAAALATDLENWIAGEPISVKAPSVAAIARQWMKRNIRLAAASLAVGIIIALIATPLCLVGFGQYGLPGSIYNEVFPSAARPLLAGLNFGLPKVSQQFEFMLIMSAVFLVSSAGAISVGWLKPANMNDAIGIGIISGIAVGISLFLLLFGWLIGGSVTTSYISSDLSILSMASVDNEEHSADELIRWRYPDLDREYSKQRARDLLANKINQDAVLLTAVANVFAAILTSMFFLPVVLAAGFYFRLQHRYESVLWRILGHIEFVAVAVLLSLALIWLAVTLFAGLLPIGTFNGPKPSISSMCLSSLLSAVAIWTIWNFKHWSARLVSITISFSFFAWFASHVLVGGNFDRDVERLLASKDYRGLVHRMDLQTRQGGTWFGSGASAIVMAAYAKDNTLRHKMQAKFKQSYVKNEHLYSSASSPLFLETMLLTPDSKENLPELERLIEYVDRFSTEKTYGTHRYQVMALVAFRRGEFEAALDYIESVPIDDFEGAIQNKDGITHHNCDDFKAVAIKAMALDKLGRSQQAMDELRRLLLVMPRIRNWADENKSGFGLAMRLYFGIEILFEEAVGQLSDGESDKEKWLNDLSGGAKKVSVD